MLAVTVTDDADRIFDEFLEYICSLTPHVTVVPVDGEPFEALLVGRHSEGFLFEGWDDDRGELDREPFSVDDEQIREIRIPE